MRIKFYLFNQEAHPDIRHCSVSCKKTGMQSKSSKSFSNCLEKFLCYYLINSISLRFTNKTNLWDSLISTATGVFTTQEGLDMVKQLYVQRQGEFGSAEHIIEKSLKNIKEETKWSDENLPVIEKWLDQYSTRIETSENSKFMG